MPLLAWKPKNVNLSAGDVDMIGEMYLYVQGDSLSNPNLSWVPTPTDSIYYIGYKAATDNVDINTEVCSSGGTVSSTINDAFVNQRILLEGQSWWGNAELAEAKATEYLNNGMNGLYSEIGPIYFAYARNFNNVTAKRLFRGSITAVNNLSDGESFFYAYQDEYNIDYQMTREGGGGAGVQFWGTSPKLDSGYVNLANYVVKNFGLEGNVAKYPFDDAGKAQGELANLGFYSNRFGGITYQMSGEFGEVNTNSVSIILNIDDNGVTSEKQYFGNWAVDGTFIANFSANEYISGSIDELGNFGGGLSIDETTVAYFDGTADIDNNYVITSYSAQSY
jgi:hypothetical protein